MLVNSAGKSCWQIVLVNMMVNDADTIKVGKQCWKMMGKERWQNDAGK